MIAKKAKASLLIALLLGITLLSFYLRFKGIPDNHPFWTDEFSSAHQARYILKHGLSVFTSINKPPLYFEDRNMTTHFLIALFFKLFGEKEWIARMPMVLIGSLVPAAMFLLARMLFGLRAGIISALFITFSYFEITWSRQGRGYMLQQFLTIVAIYLYLRLLRTKNKKLLQYILLFVVAILGIFTHPIFYLVIASMMAYYVFVYRTKGLVALLKQPLTYITLVVLVILGYNIGIFSTLFSSFFKVNNLWYYHAFLWREYGLLVFLTLAGLAMSISSNKKESILIGVYMGLYLLFLAFFFSPYTSRYLNAIFPFLYLFSAYSIVQISDIFLLHRKVKFVLRYKLIPVFIALFIIFNGHKFVTKPKSYYSLNHDFREIAVIDYHQIYNLIKTKGDFSQGKTAITETWPDRMHWYMGQDFFSAYELKWKTRGISNGIPTGNVPYFYNENGEKMTVRYKNVGLVNDASDLQKAVRKYPKGFILIDDSSLPKDVQEFAQKNLKKELYLDHYPLDDNPYAVWPATLYSWGIP